MPKLKHHFAVIVSNFGIPAASIALTQQVMSVSRPNVSFEPQTVHSYNSISYYAGKAQWEAINLTVRDDITNSVSQLIGAQLQKQMNFFDQTVPVSSADYKFGMLIHTLDGGNDNVLEEWVLEGCFIASSNYQDFDYSSADAMQIQMSIRYDNATQSGGLMPATPILASSNFMG